MLESFVSTELTPSLALLATYGEADDDSEEGDVIRAVKMVRIAMMMKAVMMVAVMRMVMLVTGQE